MFAKINNKKGQIGETLTWTVATIIIIVILAISILVVSFNFSSKKFVYDEHDLTVLKSMSAYLLTDGNYNKLSHGGDLETFNDNGLATKIFQDNYREDYPDYNRLGIVHDGGYVITDYLFFGTEEQYREAPTSYNLRTKEDTYILEEIKLNENQNFEFIGIKRRGS